MSLDKATYESQSSSKTIKLVQDDKTIIITTTTEIIENDNPSSSNEVTYSVQYSTKSSETTKLDEDDKIITMKTTDTTTTTTYSKLTNKELLEFLLQNVNNNKVHINFVIKSDSRNKNLWLYTSDIPINAEALIGNYQSLPSMYGPNPLDNYDITFCHMLNKC